MATKWGNNWIGPTVDCIAGALSRDSVHSFANQTAAAARRRPAFFLSEIVRRTTTATARIQSAGLHLPTPPPPPSPVEGASEKAALSSPRPTSTITAISLVALSLSVSLSLSSRTMRDVKKWNRHSDKRSAVRLLLDAAFRLDRARSSSSCAAVVSSRVALFPDR